MHEHLEKRKSRMLGKIDYPLTSLVPAAFRSPSALTRKIGIVGNPPKAHFLELRQYAVVNSEQHFLHDPSTGLAAQEIERRISTERPLFFAEPPP